MAEKLSREMAARILHPDTSLEAQEEVDASLDDVNEACRQYGLRPGIFAKQRIGANKEKLIRKRGED